MRKDSIFRSPAAHHVFCSGSALICSRGCLLCDRQLFPHSAPWPSLHCTHHPCVKGGTSQGRSRQQQQQQPVPKRLNGRTETDHSRPSQGREKNAGRRENSLFSGRHHKTQLTVCPPPKKKNWLELFIIVGPIFSCYHFPFTCWAPSEIKDSSRANHDTASEGSFCLLWLR